ncbi:MAG: UDP-N-acetylmuramate dehydrogenase [Bryobacteraceae bacterium]
MQARLAGIPGVTFTANAPLSHYTRFGVGGPARLLVDSSTEQSLVTALAVIRESGEPFVVIGGGSNLVANDDGFPGVVVRYTDARISLDGKLVHAGAGAVLQVLVDTTIRHGLRGLDTMTGIPGWVGGAVYGNAGAYGHSIHERVVRVRFFDGVRIREMENKECEFDYRESVFKRRKDWIVLSVLLQLEPGDATELKTSADAILKIRNEKYPPTMRCAGSIFKNLFFEKLPVDVQAQIPARLVREGKLPSAYLLEQVGVKGLVHGGVRVAEYHANLISNEGDGTAAQIRELIADLKRRVYERFGVELEEEVQYL